MYIKKINELSGTCQLRSLLIIYLLSVFMNTAVAKDRITLALSATPSQLSPFFATDASSQNINRLVHVSLTDFESDMTFGCRLCTSFEERFDEEKHIIRFRLRDDATFWDGSKVEAKHVYQSWRYFTDEESIKSNHRYAFSNIENVVIVSENVVEIIYKTFSLENLSNLSLLKIIKLNSDTDLKKISLDNIVGAGEYKLGANNSFEIVLVPIKKTRPILEFKVVRDETTLALKLLNGEIDLALSAISPRKINWLRNRGQGLNFWQTEGATYIYLGVNHRSEHMGKLKVRKAISHLLPRELVLEHKLRNTARLSTGLFSSVFINMYQESEIDSFNPVKAAKLLTEAGYTRQGQGFWEKAGKRLELDWKVSNNKAVIENVEVFKHYLEQNGIKVNTTIQEWGTFMRSVRNGHFDIIMSQWVGFTGPDMLNFVFHSQSTPPNGANRGHFIDEEMDKYLDLAKTQRDESVRTQYYKRASQIANEKYAYINLWHPNIIWIGQSCLGLNEIHSNGSYYPLLEIESNCEK